MFPQLFPKMVVAPILTTPTNATNDPNSSQEWHVYTEFDRKIHSHDTDTFSDASDPSDESEQNQSSKRSCELDECESDMDCSKYHQSGSIEFVTGSISCHECNNEQTTSERSIKQLFDALAKSPPPPPPPKRPFWKQAPLALFNGATTTTTTRTTTKTPSPCEKQDDDTTKNTNMNTINTKTNTSFSMETGHTTLDTTTTHVEGNFAESTTNKDDENAMNEMDTISLVEEKENETATRKNEQRQTETDVPEESAEESAEESVKESKKEWIKIKSVHNGKREPKCIIEFDFRQDATNGGDSVPANCDKTCRRARQILGAFSMIALCINSYSEFSEWSLITKMGALVVPGCLGHWIGQYADPWYTVALVGSAIAKVALVV